MAQLASNQCTERRPTRSGVSALVKASPPHAKGPSAQRPSAGSAAAAAAHPASSRPNAARADTAIFTRCPSFLSLAQSVSCAVAERCAIWRRHRQTLHAHDRSQHRGVRERPGSECRKRHRDAPTKGTERAFQCCARFWRRSCWQLRDRPLQCGHEFVQVGEGHVPCIGCSFRQTMKDSSNLLLAGIGFVITERTLNFGNLLRAENNILGPAIENIDEEFGNFALLIFG